MQHEDAKQKSLEKILVTSCLVTDHNKQQVLILL